MDKQIRDRIPVEDYEEVARELVSLANVDRTTVFRFLKGRKLTAGERIMIALCEIYKIRPGEVLDPNFEFPKLDEVA